MSDWNKHAVRPSSSYQGSRLTLVL
jgi:hypothetical protein